jgi:prepilin-type N-terminal cleavage/methylation domain-containing protein
MKTLNTLIARLRARSAREEGFTLIEVMVAVAILMIAILALARTATVAFTDVAAARQRQTANQLANQLVEQVRALPYENVQRGAKTNQLTGDSNVVQCSVGTYYFPNLGCPPPAGSEELVHTNNAKNADPLVPHRGSVGPPDFPSTFNWSVYVTEAADAPSAGAYRITARVTWTASQRRGVRSSVDANTLLYSPSGSVDEASHPFTGPRQAYFFASAAAGAGTMSIRPTSPGSVPGLTFDEMSADLLDTTSTVQTEQIILASGATRLPGVAVTVTGVETTAAGQSDLSQADTDPTTDAGAYDSEPNIGPQSLGTVAVSGTDRVLLGFVDGADQGSTFSATAAGGTSSCNSQTDGFACAYGSVIQPDGSGDEAPGDGGWDTSLMMTSSNWGLAEFLRVGSTTTATTTYARRTGSGPSGLARANLSWALPEIRIGGFPTEMGSPHPAWKGYWVRLIGFTASSQAESGVGAAVPSTSFGGKIEYWDNNNYREQILSSAGGSLTIDGISDTDNSVGPNSDKVEVSISGTASRERTSTVRAQSGGATTEGKVDVGSPLVVEMRYIITRNNAPEADVTITFHAGRGRVSTAYKPVLTE